MRVGVEYEMKGIHIHRSAAILVIIILTGCSAAPLATMEAINTVSVTLRPDNAVTTFSLDRPTQTATATFTATPTLRSAVTPTATATPVPTAEMPVLPISSANPAGIQSLEEWRKTYCAGRLENCVNLTEELVEGSYSEQGEWISGGWEAAGGEQRMLFVVLNRKDPNRFWVVEPPNAGTFLMAPLHWTMDGGYLYIGLYVPYSGRVMGKYGGLLRLEVASGRVTTTIKPAFLQFTEHLYWIAFSGRDQYFAYIDETAKPLVMSIRGIAVNYSRDVILLCNCTDAGFVVWSPDQKRMVYAGRTVDYSVYPVQETWGVFAIYVADLYQRQIVKFSETLWYPKGWLDASRVILVNASRGEEYIYDFGSRTLERTEATMTP